MSEQIDTPELQNSETFALASGQSQGFVMGFLNAFAAFLKGLSADKTARSLALGGVVIFIFLISVHLTLAVGAALDIAALKTMWDGGALRLDADNSVSEIVEYLALGIAIYFLLRSGSQSGVAVFHALALANLYILIDALLQIHEQLGGAINPDEIWKGQLIFFAVVGAVLLGTLVIGFVKSSPAYRGFAIILTVPLIGLFSAAVLVDSVHTIVKLGIMEAERTGFSNSSADYIQGAIAVVEDGGELFFILLNALFCYWMFRIVTLRHPRT